ncbi:Urease accessory protein [Nitrosopumilus sp. b1]|uniref:urease accessory protein UreE n=1 Tax=Nitrosopumilus sp. b1 TaxID=2109907 RepID=UPI0015F4966C|nr:Urease accessory protein [Nitrosopumilus sp. b1]KAF6243320.1 Urease accessory protein [Nitrosopumilus sp. b1]
MLKVTQIVGNIFHDSKLMHLKNSGAEILSVSRAELEKNRLRKATNLGTDVGLILDTGKHLHNGDVIQDGTKTIIVEQTPEKVIGLRVKRDSDEIRFLVGHIIGNRHRPIAMDSGKVYFPIQAESELEVFRRLFSDIIEDLELKIEERVFVPHLGANVHEH